MPVDQATLAFHENFNLINVHQAVTILFSVVVPPPRTFTAPTSKPSSQVVRRLPSTVASAGFLWCGSQRQSYLARGSVDPGACAYSDTRRQFKVTGCAPFYIPFKKRKKKNTRRSRCTASAYTCAMSRVDLNYG